MDPQWSRPKPPPPHTNKTKKPGEKPKSIPSSEFLVAWVWFDCPWWRYFDNLVKSTEKLLPLQSYQVGLTFLSLALHLFPWRIHTKLKNWKTENSLILEVFNHQKCGPKNYSKNHQISIYGFNCVVKDTEGWLKFCTSYLVYSMV
jgi:hypothetical protein